MAEAHDLDLVEVADKADPPVCKILDYGKHKYENAQKAKESKRKTKQTQVKEMKYRPKIGIGDFETKTKKVEAFLEEGNKVKVTVMFRGREVTHPELGRKILDDIIERVEHFAQVETAPSREGRNMLMVLAPLGKKNRKKKRKNIEAEEAAAAAAVEEAQAASSEAATETPAEPVEAGTTES